MDLKVLINDKEEILTDSLKSFILSELLQKHLPIKVEELKEIKENTIKEITSEVNTRDSYVYSLEDLRKLTSARDLKAYDKVRYFMLKYLREDRYYSVEEITEAMMSAGRDWVKVPELIKINSILSAYREGNASDNRKFFSSKRVDKRTKYSLK